MDEPAHNADSNNADSAIYTVQDPCVVNGSAGVSLCSSKIRNNNNVEPHGSTESMADSDESYKSSSSCVSNYSNSYDPSEASTRSFCPCKPHKGNDIRWEAIQCVKAKYGDLGLGQFRLLKKLGFGDIGSVYLAELRGMGCLFAMKVMDKAVLASRKKLARVQTERDILGSLDHPFLPTLYSHFETEKFSCLLMEFCSGGDLHALRQRQPGRHFTEQAARSVVTSTEFLLFHLLSD